MAFEEEFQFADPEGDSEEVLQEKIEHWEKLWKKGLHQVRSGLVIEIMDMTVHHLRNTINFFKPHGFNTSVLEKELADRLKGDERECMIRPKRCIDCRKTKSADEFYKTTKYRTLVSGERVKSTILLSVCKPCSSKRAKNWRIKNPERYREYHRNYKRSN